LHASGQRAWDKTPVITNHSSAIENPDSWKTKDDLKPPKESGIISSREEFHPNDRCLLLSSANDGQGRCVL
jgi:hypothetical protein